MCHDEVNGERHVVPNVTQHSRCARNALVSGGQAGRVLGRMRAGACSPFQIYSTRTQIEFLVQGVYLAQRGHTRRSRSSLEPASALPVLARPRPLLHPATSPLERRVGRPFLQTRSTLFSGGSGGSQGARDAQHRPRRHAPQNPHACVASWRRSASRLLFSRLVRTRNCPAPATRSPWNLTV